MLVSLAVDSRSATPKPDDASVANSEAAPPVMDTSTHISELAAVDDMGQSFAKRIVAEILDRSVAKYRDSLVVDGKVEEEEGPEDSVVSAEAAVPKSNYVNFDIAQTVLARDAGKEEPPSEEENEELKRNGSRTPTGSSSLHSQRTFVVHVYLCIQVQCNGNFCWKICTMYVYVCNIICVHVQVHVHLYLCTCTCI